MVCHIITLFPEIITAYTSCSILHKAQLNGLLKIFVYNLRDFSEDKHRTVDDYPYGGSAGMILKPEPVFAAVEYVINQCLIFEKINVRIVLFTPKGKIFTTPVAKEIAEVREIIFICGHYGGIDERIRTLATDEISIGDYVLTGGELAALVVIDASARLKPGVLGNTGSANEDSFFDNLLGAPQYTRPPVFRGLFVPEVLLSGHHQQIAKWRREKNLQLTYERRKELLSKVNLTENDITFLKTLGYGGNKEND